MNFAKAKNIHKRFPCRIYHIVKDHVLKYVECCYFSANVASIGNRLLKYWLTKKISLGCFLKLWEILSTRTAIHLFYLFFLSQLFFEWNTILHLHLSWIFSFHIHFNAMLFAWFAFRTVIVWFLLLILLLVVCLIRFAFIKYYFKKEACVSVKYCLFLTIFTDMKALPNEHEYNRHYFVCFDIDCWYKCLWIFFIVVAVV